MTRATFGPAMERVDVVVVSYNSAESLRDCVAPLAQASGVNVIVVDNASSDRSLETVADLGVTALPLETNLGFASGCNRGAEAGDAPCDPLPQSRCTDKCGVSASARSRARGG